MLRMNFPGRKNRRREVAIINLETALQRREKELTNLQTKNDDEKIRLKKTQIKNLKNALADTKRNLTI